MNMPAAIAPKQAATEIQKPPSLVDLVFNLCNLIACSFEQHDMVLYFESRRTVRMGPVGLQFDDKPSLDDFRALWRVIHVVDGAARVARQPMGGDWQSDTRRHANKFKRNKNAPGRPRASSERAGSCPPHCSRWAGVMLCRCSVPRSKKEDRNTKGAAVLISRCLVRLEKRPLGA